MLSELTEREETVIRMRYGIGKPTTYSLEDIGSQFCLTRERIRQIEIKSFCVNFATTPSNSHNSFLEIKSSLIWIYINPKGVKTIKNNENR